MKRKYETVELNIVTFNQEVVTSSGFEDDPNMDDFYDLSGFTGALIQ